MGPITGERLEASIKIEIITVINQAQEAGISARRSCALLMIKTRRVVRWQTRLRRGQSLANGKSGPTLAGHRVRPEEITLIVDLAKRQEYADLSHRILAVTAGDQGLFQASFSTVYRVLKAHNLMTARGPGGAHNGNSKPPVRKELTGPNQRWCWDISYLMTFEKGQYLYLYVLLDEFSRKALQWRISWHQTAQESQRLLEGGLLTQNILDLPEDQRPELINDRGRQMKAKPIKKLCEDHAMPQLFSRPRTPNDNPFIESMFGTVKRAPEYPGRFLDDVSSVTYFNQYFTWYNTAHYHSGIDYVTPDQAHQGLGPSIMAKRALQQFTQRQWRRAENEKQNQPQIITNQNKITAALVA